MLYPLAEPLIKCPNGVSSLHSGFIFDALKMIIWGKVRPPAFTNMMTVEFIDLDFSPLTVWNSLLPVIPTTACVSGSSPNPYPSTFLILLVQTQAIIHSTSPEIPKRTLRFVWDFTTMVFVIHKFRLVFPWTSGCLSKNLYLSLLLPVFFSTVLNSFFPPFMIISKAKGFMKLKPLCFSIWRKGNSSKL